LQLFCSIRYIEKKNSDEINNMFKIFYEKVSSTICNDFMAEFKCKLIL
jgi:hypothetical protein